MNQPRVSKSDVHPLSVKTPDEVSKDIAAEAREDGRIEEETTVEEGQPWLRPAPKLPQVPPSVTPLAVDTGKADEEERLLLQSRKQQELRKLIAEADKMVQDNEGRREFSRNIFAVTVIWLFLVMVVVIQCANGKWRLSDSVLIALITTTTATVIGIFIIVANYLFNRDKST